MSVARKVEQRLEGLVEGFFTKMFRSGLQPVEVGRRILREMAEGKTVSVNRVYAPNEFRVAMGPEDHERFSQMEAGLAREFGELVIDSAKENRWNLMGTPNISFVSVEEMGRGEFKVEASFSADPERAATRVGTRPPPADDPASTGAISFDTAERLGLEGTGGELLVLDENNHPRERISITRTPVVIGRLSSCDVVLSDSNVSRRHAEIRRDGKRWILVDLNSTNGSLVNGKLAKEHSLSDGDRLRFGTSELVFRTGAGS